MERASSLHVQPIPSHRVWGRIGRETESILPSQRCPGCEMRGSIGLGMTWTVMQPWMAILGQRRSVNHSWHTVRSPMMITVNSRLNHVRGEARTRMVPRIAWQRLPQPKYLPCPRLATRQVTPAKRSEMESSIHTGTNNLPLGDYCRGSRQYPPSIFS